MYSVATNTVYFLTQWFWDSHVHKQYTVGRMMQREPLDRASVYKANRLFEQFRLKQNILSFSSYKFFAY